MSSILIVDFHSLILGLDKDKAIQSGLYIKDIWKSFLGSFNVTFIKQKYLC